MNTRRSTWTKTTLLLVGMVLAAGSAGGALVARDKAGAIGAATGAAAGGLMGSVVGQPAAGALIGSGLGLGAGTLIGDELRRYRKNNQQLANPEHVTPGAVRPGEVPSH